MTTYILHGGFTRKDNESNRTFYEEIMRHVPDGGTVLLVYFASHDRDISGKSEEDIRSMKEQSHGKDFQAIIATREGVAEQIAKADAVYLRGGDTQKLIDALRPVSDLAGLLEGKTVAGSSAGAYAIACYSPYHADEPGGKIREGLGLLPLRVACHYESPDLPPDPEAMRVLAETAPEFELVLLRNCEWLVIER